MALNTDFLFSPSSLVYCNYTTSAKLDRCQIHNSEAPLLERVVHLSVGNVKTYSLPLYLILSKAGAKPAIIATRVLHAT